MANIKLGAIITDIAGSVSGSTFRRTPAGTILYNKQGTQIKSAFAQASVKNQISNIFRGWNILDLATREQWGVNALLYPVKNKFGENKFLTGRQLYTKLNTQLLPAETTSDVTNFDTYVEDSDIQINVFSKNDENLQFQWFGDFGKQYLLVSAYQIRPNGNAKPHAHFKRFYVKEVSDNDGANMWEQFTKVFPLVQQGQFFGFNIQWMNASGIITSVRTLTAEVG